MEFEDYDCSLIVDLTALHVPKEENAEERKYSHLPDEEKRNLSLISGLYLYTNTPPHGYGSQAPKVAETIERAYSFNRKTIGKTINILGRNIERMQWEQKDGDFPFDEVHGNFIPSEARIMAEEFLKRNQPYIDNCVEEIMGKILETNSDILTKGRQTYCTFTSQSTTAALAYKRMYEFLCENTGMQCFSCLEWIQAYFLLFDKENIEYETAVWKTENKVVYNRATKQKINVKRKVKRRMRVKTSSVEETREVLLSIATRFGSYIKHKERGKKDRRAIASANMILRMFLHIIEKFHLSLSTKVEGATISIGGEEKKQKISNNMSNSSLPSGPSEISCQGTEDATKWNECLSPAIFGLMHKYFFDKDTRTRLNLPQPTEMGRLFSLISVAGNFLMSMKEVQIGAGLMIYSKDEYARLEWTDDHIPMMNKKTKTWYESIKDKITDDREHVRASPGMLMGMMNAASTTVGLLAPNHRMNKNSMKVLTLRSSDDSMSLYMGHSREDNKACVEMNRRNLGMLGINLSPDKTFFFREGLGEYTSWYMDRKFVAQFGTETSALRPKGVNPHDDFFSVAKETATSLTTLTTNPVGAAIRLRLGIDGTRRLWRVNRDTGRRDNISDKVQLLADGGMQPWHCCNSHLEEVSLRERYISNEHERNYLLRIQNPLNPFAPEPTEEMTFSKEHGTLVIDTVETPRTCFNYLKKSNRTLDRAEKREEAESEKDHHEASKLVNLIDPTTLISYPSTSSTISSHLSSILKIEMQGVQLDESEALMVKQALEVLDTGNKDLLECSKYTYGDDDSKIMEEEDDF